MTISSIDCCDGSDETGNAAIKCPNTCAELRKEHDRIEAEKAELLNKVNRNQAIVDS